MVRGLKLPDAADLAGAGLALARLQLVYGLDPALLARGRVQGAGTWARLDSGHLMDIARSRYSGHPPIRPSA